MLHQHHFRAMNTDVGVWLWSRSPVAAQPLGEVEQLFREVEGRLSRFREDSELSRLNRSAGRGEVAVSPLLCRVLGAALAAARQTDGIFDPTLLTHLHRAGYDRSFELLAETGWADTPPSTHSPSGGWQQIVIHPARETVSLPAGVAVDLGGIAKGWTVDRAGELLAAWGPGLVDAGGDIRATGRPGGEVWPVAVADPFHRERDLLTLRLDDCALATSSIGKRSWQRNGERFHHLIDPRTGTSAAGDLHTVTVLAGRAAEAEVAAKTCLILGRAAGREWLIAQGHSALMIERSGRCHRLGPLPIGKGEKR